MSSSAGDATKKAMWLSTFWADEVDDAEVRDEGTDADDGDDRREAQDHTLHAAILAGGGQVRPVPRDGPVRPDAGRRDAGRR